MKIAYQFQKKIFKSISRPLLSFSKATIYIRDKDLDKTNYKASEADYVKQYV